MYMSLSFVLEQFLEFDEASSCSKCQGPWVRFDAVGPHPRSFKPVSLSEGLLKKDADIADNQNHSGFVKR